MTIGQKVWYYKNDSVESELEEGKIIDVSLNDNIAVSKMRDGRPLYQRSTTFFSSKEDAMKFMIGKLLEKIDDFQTKASVYEKKLMSLHSQYSE